VKGMPNIKSAIKRVKQNETLNAQNAHAKSAMRTAVKKADTAALNNEENAKDLIKSAIKQLIHKNAATRKKAQLMKKA
jgi:small subunit ribosomal protein S20